MSFLKSKKGITGIVSAAVGLVVLIVLITAVVMPQLKTANTSGFTASELQIWNTLGIFVILAVLIAVVYGFMSGKLK